jgi:hypothetical protein
MTGHLNRQDFDRIAFIDLEASGLGSASFPTEIGWAFFREDGFIESGSCLIRPVARWTIYANAWSTTAEHLTGITRTMLDRDGLPPGEAAARLLAAVKGRDLYSDQPDFDAHWLAILTDAAGGLVSGFKLGNAARLVDQAGAVLEFEEPFVHRAEADARRLAEAVAKVFFADAPW